MVQGGFRCDHTSRNRPLSFFSAFWSTFLSTCQVLSDHGMLCSMSRKGDCYDNAVVESFFETLKRELVDGCVYRSHEEAKQAIFEYVEVYYNRKRRHSSLGYLTPWEAECQATAA